MKITKFLELLENKLGDSFVNIVIYSDGSGRFERDGETLDEFTDFDDLNKAVKRLYYKYINGKRFKVTFE